MKLSESRPSNTVIVAAIIGLIGACLLALATLTNPLIGGVVQKYFNSASTGQHPASLTEASLIQPTIDTTTPIPFGGDFAVTQVNFSASGGCANFTATARIQTNGAGTVIYYWVRSDGGIDTLPNDPLAFDAAGAQSVSTSWVTTLAGDKWIDIYIDTPNHKQFGRAEFTCP